MKRAWKLLGFGSILLTGVVVGTALAIFPERLRRALRVQLLHRLSPWLLRCLNLKVKHQSSLQAKSNRGRLLVANHLSYVDVLMLASRIPAVFITSRETEESWEGHIARCGGSLFVERRHRKSIAADLQAIRKCLTDGLDVVLFPEGTSSNGQTLLPFRNTLLQAAVDAEAEVVSIFLDYPPATREYVAFVGSTTFAQHLWKLLSASTLDGTVWVLGVHWPARDRKSASTWSYQKINRALEAASAK